MNKNGEVKIKKISFQQGGTGYTSGRLILPTTWLNELEITKENPNVKVSFIEGKIIIEKV